MALLSSGALLAAPSCSLRRLSSSSFSSVENVILCSKGPTQLVLCTRHRRRALTRARSSNGAFIHSDGDGDERWTPQKSLARLFQDDFTSEVLVLALPALFAQAIEPLAQLAETAFVGRIGAVELAAVGVSISAFNYVSKCFNIPLLNVTASFVAEDDASGAASKGLTWHIVFVDVCLTCLVCIKSDTECSKPTLPAISSSLILAAVLGVVESLLLGLKGGAFLHMMGVTQDSVMKAPAARYLALRALASPAVVLNLALQGIFRGLKDTKMPLYATVIGSASNILLSGAFVFGLSYGVVGAAVGYIASQYAMMAYLIWNLKKRVTLLPPRLSDLRFDRFFKSGGLLLGRTLSILSTMTFSTSMAARQGPLPMAAHQVCMQLWLAASLLSDSLAIAVQTLVAGAFAKEDFDRARRIASRVLEMGLALGVGMALLIGSSSGFLAKVFTTDAGVLKVMSAIMPFVALTQPINSLAFVFDGIHYGASDFAYAAYSMMFTGAVSSAVLCLAPSFWGLAGVWVGLTVVMSLRAATGFSRFLLRSGPWSRTNTREEQGNAVVL